MVINTIVLIYIVLMKQMFRWYTALGCINVGLFIKTAMYLLAYYHLHDLMLPRRNEIFKTNVLFWGEIRATFKYINSQPILQYKMLDCYELNLSQLHFYFLLFSSLENKLPKLVLVESLDCYS